MQASDTHGTLRDVQGSLSEIEQGAWKKLRESDHKNEKSDLSSFEQSIKDLLYLAWKRENRKRVVLLLAKLLQFSSEKSWDRAARIVCQQLCLVCWASSMVDVESCLFFNIAFRFSKTEQVLEERMKVKIQAGGGRLENIPGVLCIQRF